MTLNDISWLEAGNFGLLVCGRGMLDPLGPVALGALVDSAGMQQWTDPWPVLALATYLLVAAVGLIAIFSRKKERRTAAAWVLASLLSLIPRFPSRRRAEPPSRRRPIDEDER